MVNVKMLNEAQFDRFRTRPAVEAFPSIP